jgi:hypothetical protein
MSKLNLGTNPKAAFFFWFETDCQATVNTVDCGVGCRSRRKTFTLPDRLAPNVACALHSRAGSGLGFCGSCRKKPMSRQAVDELKRQIPRRLTANAPLALRSATLSRGPWLEQCPPHDHKPSFAWIPEETIAQARNWGSGGALPCTLNEHATECAFHLT